MGDPLAFSVSSLQSSLQLLESSINTLDAGVNDFPRLAKVLQTTRVRFHLRIFYPTAYDLPHAALHVNAPQAVRSSLTFAALRTPSRPPPPRRAGRIEV